MNDAPLQYTHSGRRYLLGYGADFFGIWDRERADPGPAERFPRDDAGWASAWARFSHLEPDHIVVGLAGAVRAPAAPADGTAEAQPTAGARMTSAVPGTWWLLPLVLGWIGGIIAWIALRRRDPRLAAMMFVAGILSNLAAMWLYGRLITPAG